MAFSLSSELLSLADLSLGDRATITQVGGGGAPSERVAQLLELGFLEGAPIEVLHQAFWGGDPMVVRVRGGKVALRKEWARMIQVRPAA